MAEPETDRPVGALPGPAAAGPETASPVASSQGSATWVREHLDAVYRYARRRLAAADAEDVAQQAFVALFRAEAGGRVPDDAGAYLLGTARRRVADLHRRRAVGREPVALPPGWDRFLDEPLPDEAVASQEMADLVHVALGFLCAADRDALLARYRDAVPVAQIAEREATTTKAVEMRLYRARTRFRERLLEVGGDWTAGEGETGEGAEREGDRRGDRTPGGDGPGAGREETA
jgi:RNA polymerase sigma factor (sigma-70 family)